MERSSFHSAGKPGRARRSRPGDVARSVLGPVLAAVVAAGAGCDGTYQQFLEAVPQRPEDPGAPVDVVLGIDGLSRRAFDAARARGAFAGWSATDVITVFPGTSDYSWTRTLRAGALGGYELQYFDPGRNVVEDAGIAGVVAHPLAEGIAGTYPCYQRFDFLGDGETWLPEGYLDPLGTMSTTLDELLATVAGRARTERQLMAYLATTDVVSHLAGFEEAVATLVEVDRRVRAFKATQPRPYRFSLVSDHGNAHVTSELVDPRQVLREIGVPPVDALGAGAPLEAVPIVHVRVSYVALHTHRARIREVAARSSLHPAVDLAVAPLHGPDAAGAAPASDAPAGDAPPRRFGIWRRGELYAFERAPDGTITVEEPARWGWLGADLGPAAAPGTGSGAEAVGAGTRAVLDDRQALAITQAGPYPDIFYRVATAFTHPAARHPADVIWSMPDHVASRGFEVPGASGVRANAGFHGSLSRGGTLSVLASERHDFPVAPGSSLRADDLADLLPVLRGVRGDGAR